MSTIGLEMVEMMDRRALGSLALLLTTVVLSGCTVFSYDERGNDSIRIYWGASQKQCNNDDCTFGRNSELLTSEGRCDADPTLTWTVQSWVAGSVSVTVYDPDGAAAYRKVYAGNQAGSTNLTGPSGDWRLEGQTAGANGQLEIVLQCA